MYVCDGNGGIISSISISSSIDNIGSTCSGRINISITSVVILVVILIVTTIFVVASLSLLLVAVT